MENAEEFPLLVPDGNGPPKVFHISKTDRDVVHSFIACGNIEQAAKTNKIKPEHVRKILDREEIGEYIKRRWLFAAHRHDVTEEKIMAKLNMILDSDGNTKFDPSFTKAIETAARILKMVQPSNINVGVRVDTNPYKDTSDDELDSIIQERIGITKPKDAD